MAPDGESLEAWMLFDIDKQRGQNLTIDKIIADGYDTKLSILKLRSCTKVLIKRVTNGNLNIQI
jgi:hypothetical protein